MMSKTAEAGDQIEVEDIEVIEDDERQTEQVGDEDQSITDQDDGESDGEQTKDEDDEVVVSIGEESPPHEEETRAPEWVRELRKQNREKERRIRELEARLQTTA